MKRRTIDNGSRNDHWETPRYIYDFLESTYFKNKKYFDPCPLHSKFDGLKIEWQKTNYINPPYNRKLKESFIKKAYEESLKGKLCVMLIPATTETNIFHDVIFPNAKVLLIKGRVKFKGDNSKREYVTNKTGQTGSVFVIFQKGIKPEIITVEIPKPALKGEK